MPCIGSLERPMDFSCCQLCPSPRFRAPTFLTNDQYLSILLDDYDARITRGGIQRKLVSYVRVKIALIKFMSTCCQENRLLEV